MKLSKSVLQKIIRETIEEVRSSQVTTNLVRTQRDIKPLEGEWKKGDTFYERGDKDTPIHATEEQREEAKEKFLKALRTGTAGKLNYPLKKIMLFLILNLDRETPAQILKRRAQGLREGSKDAFVYDVISSAEIQKNILINALQRDDRWQLEHMFFEIFGVSAASLLKGEIEKYRDRELYNVFKQRLIEKINNTFEQLVREYEN